MDPSPSQQLARLPPTLKATVPAAARVCGDIAFPPNVAPASTSALKRTRRRPPPQQQQQQRYISTAGMAATFTSTTITTTGGGSLHVLLATWRSQQQQQQPKQHQAFHQRRTSSSRRIRPCCSDHNPTTIHNLVDRLITVVAVVMNLCLVVNVVMLHSSTGVVMVHGWTTTTTTTTTQRSRMSPSASVTLSALDATAMSSSAGTRIRVFPPSRAVVAAAEAVTEINSNNNRSNRRPAATSRWTIMSTMVDPTSTSTSSLPPSMFIGSRKYAMTPSILSSPAAVGPAGPQLLQRRTPLPISGGGSGGGYGMSLNGDVRSDGRVLGFDIFELDATRHPQQEQEHRQGRRQRSSGDNGGRSSNNNNNRGDANGRYRSTNRSYSDRPVKVDIDLQTWKNSAGRTLEELERDVDAGISSSSNSMSRGMYFFPIPPNRQFVSLSSSSSVNNNNNKNNNYAAASATSSSSGQSFHSSSLRSSVLPAWFPWIPTKSQIQSLKLTELKEACVQRGLIKTGSKSTLQDRLWEWTIDHQYQHQARIAGDYLTNWFEDMAHSDPSSPVDQAGRTTRSTAPKANNELTIDDSLRDGSMIGRKPSSTHSDRERGSYNEFGFPTTDPASASESDDATPNSLAEWSRNVDLDKLLEKRKEIHRQKREGKKRDVKPSDAIRRDRDALTTAEGTKEYLSKLTKTIQSSPSSPYASNKDVKEIYLASKEADQLGEHDVAIQLLESLLEITPKDARVYRRLSRLYREQGHLDQAQAILQDGLRKMPDNAWLWHGLGQLEMSKGRPDLGVRCYQRAIKEDPTFAHSYHAWGIHEHSQGRIAKAMKILKKGVEYCPTNHRLHHALGDIYRGAKMLADADRSYRRALREGPPVSHCFAFSALACVSYELGDVTEARRWLQRSIESNNGRHANGWLALAELEEAEGNTEQAIQVCRDSIIQYEKGLLEARQRYSKNSRSSLPYRSESLNESSPIKKSTPPLSMSTNAEDVKDELLSSVPCYRSGDKFINVFRHWIRLENEYGTFESANNVYERASKAFPREYRLPLDFAQYHARIRNAERARGLFVDACSKASNVSAEPFWKHAMFEMNLGNFQQAQKILFRGAQSVSKSTDGALGSQRGLAELFVTWAMCEWHLENIARSETLFDHALRLVDPGEEGSEFRSFILYNFAVLEFVERGEHLLAQHCIGLCLKESRLPGGNDAAWRLWSEVAKEMGNTQLSNQCDEIAEMCMQKQAASSSILSAADLIKQSQVAGQFQPWQEKIQRQKGRMLLDTSRGSASFYSTVRFPPHVASRIESASDSIKEDAVFQQQLY